MNVPAIQAGLPMIEQAGVPFVQVQIQGKPVEVMFDTGSNNLWRSRSDLYPR